MGILGLWEYAKEILVYGDICCTMVCVWLKQNIVFDNCEVQWETMWFLLFINQGFPTMPTIYSEALMG
jgi:hypothetical protein